MKQGSILGIAIATVIAQSCLVLALGRFTSKHMGIPWWRLSVQPWLLAIAAVGIGYAAKAFLQFNVTTNIAITVAIYIPSLLIVARILGIGWDDLRQEMRIVRSIFLSQKPSAEK